MIKNADGSLTAETEDELIRKLFRFVGSMLERNDTKYGFVRYQGIDFLVCGSGRIKDERTIQVCEVRSDKLEMLTFLQLTLWGEELHKTDISQYNDGLSETAIDIKNGLHRMFEKSPVHEVVGHA